MGLMEWLIIGAVVGYSIHVLFFRKKKGCCGECSKCSGCQKQE